MNLNDVVGLYLDAWCEVDRTRRAQCLERVWDENGTYTDPLAQVVGRCALVEHIGAFHQQFPKARIELASGVDSHHDKLRFAWRLILADETVYLEGIDFGEVSAQGQLRSIVGFFGP